MKGINGKLKYLVTSENILEIAISEKFIGKEEELIVH